MAVRREVLILTTLRLSFTFSGKLNELYVCINVDISV